MDIIELYKHDGEGYNPFLIGSKWQVAQLNYSIDEALESKIRLDVHHFTDEAFLLIAGEAALVAAKIIDKKIVFDIKLIKPGIIYNIPKGTLHNIVLTCGTKVLIIEDANTHLPLPEGDYEFYYFSDVQKAEFTQRVKDVFNK